MGRLKAVWHWLVEPTDGITGPDQRRRAKLLATFLLAFLPPGLLLGIGVSWVDPSLALHTQGATVWIMLALLISMLVAYGLNRAGQYNSAAVLVVGSGTAAIFALPMPYVTANDLDFLAFLVLMLLLGSLLLPNRHMMILFAADIIGIFLLPVLFPHVTFEAVFTGPFSFVLLGSVLVLFIVYHRNQLEVDRQVELSEKEERYRSLLETAFEAIIITRAEEVIDANTGFTRMFGYVPAELVGKGLFDFVDPSLRETTAQIIEIGTDRPYESLGLRKNGSQFAIELVARELTYRGRTIRAVAIRDITERKKVEEVLAQRGLELALLNRAGRALSASLDMAQVLATLVKEVQHLLGVVACSVWLIVEERNRPPELVCREITGPNSEMVRGWRMPLGEGLVGWVAQNAQSLYVPDVRKDSRHFKGVDKQTGLVLYSILSVPLQVGKRMVGVLQVLDSEIDSFSATDVAMTESLATTAAIAIENAGRFAQEEQRAAALARTLDQQKELDRLRSEFIQNVAHELRTPLAIARGYAELLDGGELGALQPEHKEPVGIILRRLQMLSKMMDDIAAILDAETRMLAQEPVDLGGMVQAMLVDFRRSAEQAGLTLEAEIAPDTVAVMGDTTQLQRVLDNLLGNACKFTPSGGRVTVRVRQHEGRVIMQVVDTGIGIALDQQNRIFERFYQVDGSTRRRYGGVGLGLALAREIVEAHRGTISVKSTLGEGSVFTVALPVLEQQSTSRAGN